MIRLKVKELARKRDISQSKLSRLADVDPGTMRRIFSGEANITLETLERIARALHVSPTELLEYEENDTSF